MTFFIIFVAIIIIGMMNSELKEKKVDLEKAKKDLANCTWKLQHYKERLYNKNN